MLDALREQFKPMVGRADSINPTVPVNPLTLFTVIVETPVEPWPMVRDAGLATTLKSGGGTVTVNFVDAEAIPLDPVTVTKYEPARVPAGTEMVSWEVPVPPATSETLGGLKDGWGPAGDTIHEKATMPENPLRLFNVMVDCPKDPMKMLSADGLAETARLPGMTMIVTLVELDCEALVPVTVTV